MKKTITSAFLLLFFLKLSENTTTADSLVSMQVKINDTVTLAFRVPAEPQLSFVWMLNYFGFSSETVSQMEDGRYSFPGPLQEGVFDLLITKVSLRDDGEFYCQVKNQSQEIIHKKRVNLTVLVPPEKPFLTQIESDSKKTEILLVNKSASVTENDGRLTLRCEAAHGRPPPILRWLVDESPVIRKLRVAGSIEIVSYSEDKVLRSNKDSKLSTVQSTLELKGIKRIHHKVEVSCESTSLGFEKSPQVAKTQLSVSFGPDVSVRVKPLRPNNQYTEGDLVEFICDVKGRPNTFTYSWSKAKLGGKETRFENQNESSYQLKITREHNLHDIRCGATAIDFKMAMFGPLRVHYPPQITLVQKLYPASIGDSEIIMRCDADANPPAQYEWKRKGSSQTLSRTSVLKITNVKQEDFGEYECEAHSEGFSPARESVWLALRTAPKIVSPRVQYGRSGLSIKLLCEVSSVPEPLPEQLLWFRMGRPMETDSRRYHIYTTKLLGGVKLVLYIREVEESDFGSYNCSVKNGYGHANDVITLAAKDEVPIGFVAGAAVTIVMISIFMTVVLCLRRRGVCERQYIKASMSECNTDAPRIIKPMSMESNPANHELNDGVLLSNRVDEPWINCEGDCENMNNRTYYRYSSELDDSSQVNTLQRKMGETQNVHHANPSYGYFPQQHHQANGGFVGYHSVDSSCSSPCSSLGSRGCGVGASHLGGGANTMTYLMPQVLERDEELYRDESIRSCDSGYAGLHHQQQQSHPGAPMPATIVPKPFSYTHGCLLPPSQKGVVNVHFGQNLGSQIAPNVTPKSHERNTKV